MRVAGVLLWLLTLLVCFQSPVARAETAVARAERAAEHDTTAYSLPPEKLQKATTLTRIWTPLSFGGEAWTVVQLLLLLALGVVARLRDFVVRLSKNWWTQGFLFVFLLLLTTWLLNLPLKVYGHHLSLAYGFSVQGWGSWLADQAKVVALIWGLGGSMTMVLFLVIRKSPERWWFWFWIPAVVFTIIGVFITPYVIDPLFNKFEPLAQSNPALVQQLERVVQRGGIAIPPERMFLMKASAKVTVLNAYVTGFGSSKRVVVWDTTIAKATPDEIVFIFGHEMGHYALNHIVIGTTAGCFGLLVLFWLGFHGMRLLLRRYGGAWRIPSQKDWGALVVLLLVITVLNDLSDPISNYFSRMIEHNADIYGQEAVHGIVADPQKAGRDGFQVLGEVSLDDPTPHPFIEFWTYTHPPIRTRAAFAAVYDPWAPGAQPKYFRK